MRAFASEVVYVSCCIFTNKISVQLCMRPLISLKLNRVRAPVQTQPDRPSDVRSLRNEVLRRLRSKASAARNFKLNGLGTRDIPIYGFPVKDIPRLERGSGFIGIDRVLNPTIMRNS